MMIVRHIGDLIRMMRIPPDYTQVELPDDAPQGATAAFANPSTLVIVGQPDHDEAHNCDAMGCRRDHVLERRQINA